MSKYESRADDIRKSAAENRWDISWKRQGSRIYATVKLTDMSNPFFATHMEIRNWLEQYYKEPVLTSGRRPKWTFLVCDIVEALKRQ